MNIKISVLCLFLTACFAGIAQSNDYDSRLLSRFDSDQLAKMESTSPATLAYWSYYIENRATVHQAPENKDLSSLNKIKGVYTDGQLDLFKMDISKFEKTGMTFLIEGTNTLLVLPSEKRFLSSYNSQLSTSSDK